MLEDLKISLKKKLFKITMNLDILFHKIDIILHKKARVFFAQQMLNHARNGYVKEEEISPRVFEYSFVIGNMPERGRVLDVGCTAGLNLLPIILSELGYEVYGIDLRPFKIRSNNFQLIIADARHLPFRNVFDVCYSVSTIEHIGLPSTVSVVLSEIEDLEGDVKAIKEMQSIVKSKGVIMITVPFGKSDILPVIASRIYDASGIERLLNGLTIVAEEYVLKIGDIWRRVSRNEATKANHAGGRIAVAMFKTCKPTEIK